MRSCRRRWGGSFSRKRHSGTMIEDIKRKITELKRDIQEFMIKVMRRHYIKLTH
jgi:hypothetical protein